MASIMLSSGLIEHAKAADVGSNVLPSRNGFLYDESSMVEGTGQVSIKGSFADRSANSNTWMKGAGSINLESLNKANAGFSQAAANLFANFMINSNI